MITIKDLSKAFGPITAVDGVSFEVDRGEVLGFLGPNGAGKSTTMKMVTGFLSPTSGTVSVCGHDVIQDPLGAKRAIGYLPEGAPAYGDMTPESFLAFVAEVRGVARGDRRRRIGEVSDMVHLEGVMRQPIETLSKGYKRRVGLAQALLHDPEVLILDEPTDGLDPNQKHEIRGLITRMAGRKAIVLSTHILEEVEATCTRAMIISQGRIVADGTPASLQARSHMHNAVRLAVQAPAEDVERELAELDGVAFVERLSAPSGAVRCRVLASEGAIIVDAISSRVRERGWPLDELTVEEGRLDDVFRTITVGDLGPRAATAATAGEANS
ncbi:MAG: ABC transporter ATP-binding protein [Planctomycetota bacterium]